MCIRDRGKTISRESVDQLQFLAAVDVDRIARDMDFQALQDNLEQITFCNIDSEVVSGRFRGDKEKMSFLRNRIRE